MMLLLPPLVAQDTVHIRDMRLIGSYFVPVWPDAFPTVTDPKGNQYIKGWLSQKTENYWEGKETAYKMYTEDTLQVYGIAASLTTPWRLRPDYYEDQIQAGTLDTSCEYLYDYLRLYEADPDSLRHIGEELLVNLRYTPVSYYIDLDLFKAFEGHADSFSVIFQPILPMYERYFSEPVTVADSFYVGRRYRPDHHDGRDVVMPMLADSLYYGTQYYAIYWDFVRETAFGTFEMHQWSYAHLPYQQHPFLFPIIALPDTTDNTWNPVDTIVTGDVVLHAGNTLVITPGDTLVIGGTLIVNTGDTLTVALGDTVVIGGDTLVLNPGDTLVVSPGDTLFVNSDGSIVINSGGTVTVNTGGTPDVGVPDVDLVHRYTSLQPNPATQRVTVTSSFGISRIEAYDTRGHRIFETHASGLKTDLDISSWPRGTYLLRITTPAGSTTNKLLVQ